MGSPWTTQKKTDSLALKSGEFCPLDEGIEIDTECFATVVGDARLDIKATKDTKVDVYLNRESSDNNTAWQSYTITDGYDGIFYLWATWMGEVTDGETYRWYIRLGSGLSGAVTTRYTKGSILIQPDEDSGGGSSSSGALGLTTLAKFSTDGSDG
jgi:hypothetical protein